MLASRSICLMFPGEMNALAAPSVVPREKAALCFASVPQPSTGDLHCTLSSRSCQCPVSSALWKTWPYAPFLCEGAERDRAPTLSCSVTGAKPEQNRARQYNWTIYRYFFSQWVWSEFKQKIIKLKNANKLPHKCFFKKLTVSLEHIKDKLCWNVTEESLLQPAKTNPTSGTALGCRLFGHPRGAGKIKTESAQFSGKFSH